jgi:hypothetical protein
LKAKSKPRYIRKANVSGELGRGQFTTVRKWKPLHEDNLFVDFPYGEYCAQSPHLKSNPGPLRARVDRERVDTEQCDEDPKTTSRERAHAFSILYLLSIPSIYAPTKTIHNDQSITSSRYNRRASSQRLLPEWLMEEISFIVSRHLDYPLKRSISRLI